MIKMSQAGLSEKKAERKLNLEGKNMKNEVNVNMKDVNKKMKK